MTRIKKLRTTNHELRTNQGFTPTPVFTKFRLGETREAHRKNRCRGFTLIEMLVAITVLLLSIGGPLTIAAQAVFSANIAKDRLTAAYLAQEGIELMRAKRDGNAIQGSGWLSGLDDCLSGSCYIATINFSVNACNGSCPPLGYNEQFANYGYGGSPPSIFTRTITIEEVVSDQEAIVTSVVEWQAGGRTHQVTLTENLFNWR